MEARGVIYLDTHVVAWLYIGSLERLSSTARAALEEDPEPTVSPMVLLELEYLYEIGRAKAPSAEVLASLQRTLGLRISDTPFETVAARAATENWTRDPFDRIIVAQAALDGAPLLSRDRQIAEHYAHILW
jgi:PIN domain nuclease of toxin-antitoxin system